MDKVYVVTEGRWSEYHIEKIFSNREDAELYCAAKNASDDWTFFGTEEEQLSGEYWRDGYRIEEYPIDDVKMAGDSRGIKRRYRYVKVHDSGLEYIEDCGEIYEMKSWVKVNECSKEHNKVVAVLDRDIPMETVKKIIYDEVACYAAEVNGLV